MVIYKGHNKGFVGFVKGDDATELFSVSRNLFIFGSTKAEAPNLTEVLGKVTITSRSTLNAESLTVAGYIHVFEGGTFNAPSLKNAAGVRLWRSGVLNAPNLNPDVEIFREIACSEYYLFASQKQYKSGCRGPWTAEKALAHWGQRSDERAKLFVEAIKANEKRKLK